MRVGTIIVLFAGVLACGDDPECRDASDCPAPRVACAQSVCSASCGFVEIPGVCGVDERCDFDVGCVGEDIDGGFDGSFDASVDAAIDTAERDVPIVGIEPPRLRSPHHGWASGSMRVPLDASVAEHPLRPRLRWVPVDGALEYEIELDDSCRDPDCTFRSPELRVVTSGVADGDTLTFIPEEALPIRRTPPVGARYGWRMRSCDASGCGPWSESRYFDVGRSPHDYDGDGWPDVAIGAFGAAYVFYGDGSGVPELAAQRLDAPGAGGGAGDVFGEALASGDIDGDGFSDLVVGDPLGDAGMVDVGVAYVYFGSTSGLSSTPAETLTNPSDIQLNLFGSALTIADVDANGLADVMVGAPRHDRGAPAEGSVFVFLRRPTSFDAAQTVDSPANQSGAQFGDSVSARGDLDGDGIADLVVGASLLDSPVLDAGAIYVFFGGPPMGIDGVVDDMVVGDGAITAANFGVSVAVADANADGLADVLVGASQFSSLLTTLPGGATRLLSFEGVLGDAMPIDDPEPQGDAHYGHAVAFGDVEGDGTGRAWVGAPQWDGSASDVGTAVYDGRDRLQASTEMANLGETVSLVDVNADGRLDRLAGAPRSNGGAGAVWIYLGGSTLTIPDYELTDAGAMRLGRGLPSR